MKHNDGIGYLLAHIAVILAFVGFLAAYVSASFWLPCGWYAGTAQKDVPMRCVR